MSTGRRGRFDEARAEILRKKGEDQLREAAKKKHEQHQAGLKQIAEEEAAKTKK